VKTPKSDARVQVIQEVPKIEALMKKYRPDIVVVQTGSNLYANLRSKRLSPEERVKNVNYLCARMCKAVSQTGRSVFWICPPQAHAERFPLDLQDQMRKLMMETAAPHGRVFDSYAVTKFTDPYPETDGIHYGPKDAAEWAQKVAADFLKWAPTVERGKPKGKESNENDETVRKPDVAAAGANNAIEVVIRLRAKSSFKTPREVTYRNALALYEYDVVRVVRGKYPYKTLRLAHLVMHQRKIMGAVNWPIGKTLDVELVPLSSYPTVEKIQMQDDLELAPELPIFIPKM
jgi:hypothetical protein